MSAKPSILRCQDIHKSFSVDRLGQSGLPVLRGIDLDVKAGEIITMVGASGSGKSTLLHVLGGLDRPTRGTVWWGDRDLSRIGDTALDQLRGTYVGFVFQFHHLLPEFTALENVMIPQMIQRRPARDAATHGMELLRLVGLEQRSEHRPSELSGGEQQRVAVARALANSPKIVLADEPTGNLDSVSSQQLHDLLWELNTSAGQSFIIVTHNEQFAEHSDRVFTMVDGQLQLSG
jgi:lipoprotein-releasing system ATP-binding protein